MKKSNIRFAWLMALGLIMSSLAQAKNIKSQEIAYEHNGVKLTGYIAYDADSKQQRPGVLIVHEWWGHSDYVRTRARQLAEMGYVAFALDMYGDGKLASHPDDAKKFMTEALANMPEAVKRFEASRKILEDHPASDPEKTAAIGYCFGGAIVLHMARTGMDLDGVASFHGSLGTESPVKAGELKSKILVLHGDADPFVPKEEVAAFKAEMSQAKADMNFIGYPKAVHAFTNPGATAMGQKFDMPLAYDESADKQSWQALTGFLNGLW